ncbi:MAG TPA: glycoside hydrolase domain-containing protein [Candidatus Dormibacteraeota bacterium]|nr:glycoside hydrolase domain-containing protein [Candidatus Dormibacteraeota bacterium]
MQPTKRVPRRGRKPQSVGAVLLAIVSVSAQMVALAAFTGAVPPTAARTPNAVMAAALLRGLAPSPAPLAGAALAERIEVPTGSAQCPNSGAGAACTHASALTQPGSSSLPDGLAACPPDGDKSVDAPGACTAAAVPVEAGDAPTQLMPVLPTVTLSVDKTVLASDSTAVLVATATADVTGTPWAIQIFDMNSRTPVGACAQSSTCTVAYKGKAGQRTFVAYVMPPGQKVPTGAIASASNRVIVRWLGVDIAAAKPAIAAPGKPITFTATASENVSNIGYRIELRDSTSGQLLTFCSDGTTCSTSLVEPAAGTRTLTAALVAQSPASHAGTVSLNATSGTVSGTWLGVSLDSSSTAGLSGGAVSLTATANADLSQTPWSIYIQNDAGQQIGLPCNARQCSATVNIGPNDKSSYRAIIAGAAGSPASSGPLGAVLRRVPAPAARLDLQASSQLVRPARMLWGVDSCKSFLDSGLLGQVTSSLGAPDFWGRYLPSTGYCPALSGAEIQAAHDRHMGILPIFNDYDCSAVSGNGTGTFYGQQAVGWTVTDRIPKGTAIAIDIEPPGDACPGAANVDKGFIEGWYDGVVQAGYVPAFYGNTSGGSAFATAWCSAVAERPEIATHSYLWSFEPSLIQGHDRGSAPTFGPNYAGCSGHYVVWQYSLSAGSSPDVDADLASTEFPFWWP